MSDEVIPLWKRNANAKGAATRRERRSLREDIDAVLASFAGDSLGRQAWLRTFAHGGAEDRRALLQARVRLEPTEVHGSMDAMLTVKIVKQVGERVIEIAGGHEANFHRPPRDAATGERLPVATLPGSATPVPEGDGDA